MLWCSGLSMLRMVFKVLLSQCCDALVCSYSERSSRSLSVSAVVCPCSEGFLSMLRTVFKVSLSQCCGLSILRTVSVYAQNGLQGLSQSVLWCWGLSILRMVSVYAQNGLQGLSQSVLWPVYSQNGLCPCSERSSRSLSVSAGVCPYSERSLSMLRTVFRVSLSQCCDAGVCPCSEKSSRSCSALLTPVDLTVSHSRFLLWKLPLVFRFPLWMKDEGQFQSCSRVSLPKWQQVGHAEKLFLCLQFHLVYCLMGMLGTWYCMRTSDDCESHQFSCLISYDVTPDFVMAVATLGVLGLVKLHLF